MAQLHETMYGKKLLEGDIPRIAKALERIADSLEKIEEERKPETKVFSYKAQITK